MIRSHTVEILSGVVALIAAAALAVMVLRQDLFPSPGNVDFSMVHEASKAPERIAQLQRNLSDIVQRTRLHISELQTRIDAAKLIDPGPEPRWWHPIDHWYWKKKEKANTRIREQIEHWRGDKSKAQQDLNTAVQTGVVIEKIAAWSWLKRCTHWIWLGILAPILHFSLLLSVAIFMPRIVLRLLLISGAVERTHV